MPEMSLADVLAFLEFVDGLQIQVWLDGGWAVDASHGEQSRWHSDLDIVVEARHSPTLVYRLAAAGFEPVPREGTSAWNFVLGDEQGRHIDIQLVEFDSDGTAHRGPDDVYPADALSGVGLLGERTVRCIAAGYVRGSG